MVIWDDASKYVLKPFRVERNRLINMLRRTISLVPTIQFTKSLT